MTVMYQKKCGKWLFQEQCCKKYTLIKNSYDIRRIEIPTKLDIGTKD
jgi:hypothetical protein